MNSTTILILSCLAIVFGVLTIIAAVVISQKNTKKVKRMAALKELPEPLLLRSSLGSFLAALFEIGIFTAAFLIFRYLLSKGNGAVDVTPQFVIAVIVVGIFLSTEMFGVLSAFIGFFARKLRMKDGSIFYTNFLGITTTIHKNERIRYRTVWFCRIRPAIFIRFVDDNGKKCTALICLSDYSAALLRNCFEKHNASCTNKG